MDVHDLVHAGHGQHRLHAGLQPGELEHAAAVLEQPPHVHEAADRGTVDVAHRREVDDDLAGASLHELPHLGEEGGEVRVGELGLLHPDDLHVAAVRHRQLHHFTSGPGAAPGPPRVPGFVPAAGRAAAAGTAPPAPG